MTYKIKKTNNITVLDINDECIALSTNGFRCLEISCSTGEITVADGQYTLPTTDGEANQVIKTDGNGNLSWTDQTTGSTTTSTSTTTTISTAITEPTQPSWRYGRWWPQGNGFNFSSTEATYQKVGNMVTATFKVVFPQNFEGSVGSNVARITKLPFTSQASHKGFGSIGHMSNGQSDTRIYVQPNSDYIGIANHSAQNKQNANFAGATLQGGVTYFVSDIEVSRLLTLTGATSQGPAVLVDTTANESNWYKLSAPLEAGNRLVLNSAFVNDIASEMNNGDKIFIGLKDSSWANTKDGSSTTDSGFQGNFSLYLEKAAGIQGDTGTLETTIRNGTSDGTTTTSTLGQVTTTTEVTGANSTDWAKSIDFSGNGERLEQLTTATANNPLAMNGSTQKVFDNAFNAGGTHTTTDNQGRPWAMTIVFKADRHNSNQKIWNFGQGYTPNGANMYLRLSAIGNLFFGIGQENTTLSTTNNSYNECRLIGGSGSTLSSNGWYGVYIGFTGERRDSSENDAATLARAFDIKIMNNVPVTNTVAWDTLQDVGASSNWITTGYGTRGNFGGGQLTIGGEDSNNSFHGKVASMVITTLRGNVAMPSDAEIEMMITDPMGWKATYKDGQPYRMPNTHQNDSVNFGVYGPYAGDATQIWLMGDGNNDGYTSKIRNQVYDVDAAENALSFVSMSANDIEDTDINGLTSEAITTTCWDKALRFTNSGQRAEQAAAGINNNPLAMSALQAFVGANSTAGYTSDDTNARPWATAVVFKIDGHNSNQMIWNFGEGSSQFNDNIYLRLDSSRELYFGWGRYGTTNLINECYVADLGGSVSGWHGVYIGSTGERLRNSEATAANLADCFDIRYTRGNLNWALSANKSTSTNWTTNGYSMGHIFGGGSKFCVGGQYGNKTFRGRVASMVVTTLRRNVPMPTNAEITEMIKDPINWLNNYKVGQPFRRPQNSGDESSNFQTGITAGRLATQIWLMGDGTNDSYSNGIRNQVAPTDNTYTKLEFPGISSDPIVDIAISGLDCNTISTTTTTVTNPQTTETMEGFIELAKSGNAIRAASTEDSATYSPTLVAYSGWTSDSNGTEKKSTGNQGYGLTSSDIMIYWDRNSTSAGDFDISEIDWSNLIIYDSTSD